MYHAADPKGRDMPKLWNDGLPRNLFYASLLEIRNLLPAAGASGGGFGGEGGCGGLGSRGGGAGGAGGVGGLGGSQ